MTTKSRLSLSLALAATALLSLAAIAGATSRTLDSYCSESGDICEHVLQSKKSGDVKFVLQSFTPAVQGEYTLCVKGPDGKDCEDFALEEVPAEVPSYSDKVNWQKEFPNGAGSYVVKWKYQGERLGKKLHFDIGQVGEAKRPTQIDDYCSPSGDVCQEITLSRKGGRIKFGLFSFTAAVQGDYTLCVKGPRSKECKDFVLEQLPDEEVWADRVSWEDNFPSTAFGQYIVKWKYMGERLGRKLHFDIGQPGES